MAEEGLGSVKVVLLDIGKDFLSTEIFHTHTHTHIPQTNTLHSPVVGIGKSMRLLRRDLIHYLVRRGGLS